jgi:hypothetical protein
VLDHRNRGFPPVEDDKVAVGTLKAKDIEVDSEDPFSVTFYDPKKSRAVTLAVQHILEETDPHVQYLSGFVYKLIIYCLMTDHDLFSEFNPSRFGFLNSF